MADLLQQGASWLESQRDRHLTQDVTYHHGNDAVAVRATIGRTLFELDNGSGGVIRQESRDFLILASLLVLAAVPIQPRRGDRIEQADGIVYEVLGPGDEPCWRWSDLYRTTFRIHAKEVGAA